MTDLYGVLGVDRKADHAAIRRAYRRKSKSAHPDGGGTPEQFALVKRAHDVLSDAARRSKYDATGEAEEAGPDNRHAMLLEVLAWGLDRAMAKLYDAGAPPKETDMVSRIRSALHERVSADERERGEWQKNRVRTAEMLGRFVTSDGPNMMENILRGRLAQIDQAIANKTAEIEKVTTALGLLKGVTFKADSPSFDYERRARQNAIEQAFGTAFSRFGVG